MVCVASHGHFLTLLEAREETYVLRRAIVGVGRAFLTIPKGVWNGRLGG